MSSFAPLLLLMNMFKYISSLEICTSGSCTLYPTGGEDIICTNGASSCTVNCGSDDCFNSTIILAASLRNTVICDGDSSCNTANIYCGQPDTIPTNYTMNNFTGYINLCEFELSGKASFDSKTIIKCSGDINMCQLRAYPTQDNFKNADFICELTPIYSACHIDCDDATGCGNGTSNFYCNAPTCSCNGNGCNILNIHTQNPTLSPTNPSKSPTINPTLSPTNIPTISPTYNPTLEPTENTINPTNHITNTQTTTQITTNDINSSSGSIIFTFEHILFVTAGISILFMAFCCCIFIFWWFRQRQTEIILKNKIKKYTPNIHNIYSVSHTDISKAKSTGSISVKSNATSMKGIGVVSTNQNITFQLSSSARKDVDVNNIIFNKVKGNEHHYKISMHNTTTDDKQCENTDDEDDDDDDDDDDTDTSSGQYTADTASSSSSSGSHDEEEEKYVHVEGKNYDTKHTNDTHSIYYYDQYNGIRNNNNNNHINHVYISTDLSYHADKVPLPKEEEQIDYNNAAPEIYSNADDELSHLSIPTIPPTIISQ